MRAPATLCAHAVRAASAGIPTNAPRRDRAPAAGFAGDEFELSDTEIFDDDKYFDIESKYDARLRRDSSPHRALAAPTKRSSHRVTCRKLVPHTWSLSQGLKTPSLKAPGGGA